MSQESIKYNTILSTYFSSQSLFFNGDQQKKPHIRKCVELPFQQTKAGLWDEVTDTLCNLDFIQAKAVAKMTYDLVKDFNDVLEVIPDNAENIWQEKARQARMEKYTRDLIACAKGEIRIDELQIPESITPWPKEKIDAEIERIKTYPARIDILKDFLNFLGRESGNLQYYASDFSHFATQQAWNYSVEGPVGKAAEKGSLEVYKSLLRLFPSARPPWNPLPQVLRTLIEHTGIVHAVSITPDGQWAVSGSQDGTCILWNMKTGKTERTLRGHKSRIQTVSITPDGQMAISGSTDKTCILWDLKTGQVIQRYKENSGWISSVSITSDGKRGIIGIFLMNIDTDINSDKKRNCIILDFANGHLIQTLPGHISDVLSVSITPDGKRAVSSSYDITYKFWDLTTGQALQAFTGNKSFNRAISITPDGKRAISNSNDNSCILWDLETGKELKTLIGHNSPVNAVSITPDGKKAFSGSTDSTCILWDLETGNVVKTFKGHTDCINSVSITANGQRAISGSKDNTCILWDTEMGKELEILMNNISEIKAISVTSQGHRVISGPVSSLPNFGEHNCTLWDLKTGQVLKILRGHTSIVNSFSVTPDGQRAISCSNDHTCILWDLCTGQALQTLKSEIFGPVNAVSIAANGQRAISAHGTTCILWDLGTNKSLRTLIGHKQSVWTICFTPDGMRAITGSADETCILWDLGTGRSVHKFKGHTDPIHTISITPDGQRLISGAHDKTCIVWDIRTGHSIQTLKGHTGWISNVLASPDGQRVITGSKDKTCIIWDLATGNKSAIFTSDSPITTLKTSWNTIIIGHTSGKVEILDSNKRLLCPDIPIATVCKIWDIISLKSQKFSADCPLCGHCFNPPDSILATIFKISKEADLKPDQSPCLELPDEAWEDPGLLGNCPKCGAELKFNPFIAGGDDYYH